MTSHRGLYSIIQYCPDHARMEAANIGVLLWAPALQYLDVRVAESNDRVRRFFRPDDFNFEAMSTAKELLAGRIRAAKAEIRSEDDLFRFVRSRGGEFVLTDPRVVAVPEPEPTLGLLFQKLVGGRRHGTGSRAVSRQYRKLSKMFETYLSRGNVYSRQILTDPAVPVSLRVDYSIQNGRMHHVKFFPLTSDPHTLCRRALEYSGRCKVLSYDKAGSELPDFEFVGSKPRPGEETAEKQVVATFRKVGEGVVRFVRHSEVDGAIKRWKDLITEHG